MRPEPRQAVPGKAWRSAVVGVGAALALVLAALAVAHRPPAPEPRVAVSIAPPAPLPAPLTIPLPAPLPAPSAEPVAVPPPAPEPMPAWLRFAATVPPVEGRPRIAVVIDDLGLDRGRSERAIALAPALTLAIMAYAAEARGLAESAHLAGHELLVHVPMEPLDHAIDMGPNGLAVSLPHEEVLRRLRWDLDRLDFYVGINNHMGSRFTADAQAMTVVIGELKERGLLFLDSRTSGATVGARVAQRLGVPFAERDVFLDDVQSAAAIAARLGELEEIARKRGTAIAIGHPHDATLAALGSWIETLPRKNLVLVPLTEIVKTRAGATLHAEAGATSPTR